jgi:uncharacterized protein (TIGR03118 family)
MNSVKKVLEFRATLVLLLLLSPTAAFAQHYVEADLVSSIPGVGTNATNGHDTQLVNAWGLTRSATSPWWLTDNGTGLSTVYNAIGNKVATLVVTIPPPAGSTATSAPTGTVFNGTATDFLLPSGASAHFIFVTEDGTISAWSSGAAAILVVDNSKKNAVYKGCTIAEWNGKHYLYVTNFRSGEIEVYDNTFKRVHIDRDAFSNDGDASSDFGRDRRDDDRRDDDRRHHEFVPFNVQAIGTNLFVTFAKQDDVHHDEVDGAGLGDAAVFSTSGKLLSRMQHGSYFNGPWGVAMAPGEFGEFSHSVLVGMFGSGQVAAFNPVDGKFIGVMLNHAGTKLSISGLWAIGFGAGNTNSGPYNTLYFTAGPNDEGDGLYGTLVVDPATTELAEEDEP